MNLEGRKISGSANWAVWGGLDILDRYDADAIRYYLTVTMPETRDTDWDWEDFFNRNNSELLATWGGNLANRVLSFTYKTGLVLFLHLKNCVIQIRNYCKRFQMVLMPLLKRLKK